VEPGGHARRARMGFESTGGAPAGLGQRVIVIVQPLQQPPGRRFADGDVGVAGALARHHCGIDDAHRQPGEHQGEQQRQLVVGQRQGAVIGGDEFRRGRQRLVLIHHGVGRRHGRLTHDHGAAHVAEVHDAGEPLAAPSVVGHQQVVIIGVTEDGAAAKAFEPRGDALGEIVHDPVEPSAAPWILDQAQVRPDPGRAAQVPLELAPEGRVPESGQRLIEPPERRADLGPERRRVRTHRRHHPAGKESQEPGQALPAGVRQDGRGRPVARGNHALERQRGRALGQMRQRPDLHLHERRIAAGPHDLEKVSASPGLDVDVEVVFARQEAAAAGQSVRRAEQPLHRLHVSREPFVACGHDGVLPPEEAPGRRGPWTARRAEDPDCITRRSRR